MPKLNVQQNNQNIIQAFRNALAIGRLKGIIASDGNHNFSTSGSNPNLLDNAYFVGGGSQLGDGVFPINQRGQTQYAGGGGIKGLDRWKIGYPDGTITLNANGLTLSAYKWLFQPLRKEVYEGIEGEIVTASVLTADGTLYTGTNTFTANADVHFAWLIAGGENLELRTSNYSGNPSFQIVNFSPNIGTPMTIAAVKLEKGSYSTLLNDVQPDFEEELRKCKRYFLRLNSVLNFPYGTGIAHNATSLRVFIPTQVTMRNTPTVSFTGSLVARGNGSSLTVTGLPSTYLADNGVAITATTTGATQYQTYSLIPSSAGHIELSAEP